MRVLAPLLVAATVVLFGSGVAMGVLHGQALDWARLHGPASVIWLSLLGLHVLVYFTRAVRKTADDAAPEPRSRARGAGVRALALAAAIVSGLVIAAATVPAQHHWIDIRHDRHDAARVAFTLWRKTAQLS
jgi:peptidoglycan/LPS O-acetylase OafA/YrhL